MRRRDSGIARILREARTGQGLSQRELGQRSGLTQAQISLIENGEVDSRLSSLIAVVDVLGLDLTLTPRPPSSAPPPTQSAPPPTQEDKP
ncbi:MAG: helix-turn-helix transcriptional regulator [bacterium]|nr:helix-turn-helix transcriptional regulator [bacterium]MDE0234451.1 helix-turn-helix transcriptional regulator [bacterium]